ncbi:hypothetical protein PoB_000742200 [Plakobranchus ocellatus]|uniref:T20D4.11-like domain-containing protein n=1 Tax=Plakobranchus ocellatus TaxID=259542 RepID=A0AAV3YFH1_9GAST|nr:hypothetical protein PoB_000742200 [Plakobranchus ocellatus]
MATILKFSAFIIASVVVTESLFIRRDVYDGEMDCYMSKHLTCVLPNLAQYDASLETLEMTSDFLSNSTRLEELAAACQVTVECLENVTATPECQGSSEPDTLDTEIELVATYLAVPEHIDILVNLSSSVCFTDHSFIEQLEYSFGAQCIGNFFQQMHAQNDVCEELVGLKDCVADIAASMCGPAAGNFVQSLWDFAIESDVGSYLLFQLPVPDSTVEECFLQAQIVRRYATAIFERMRR